MSLLTTAFNEYLYEVTRVFIQEGRLFPRPTNLYFIPMLIFWGMFFMLFIMKLTFRLMGRNDH